jgi:hypothetical protein
MLDKILSKFILKDAKTGKPSYTVSAFVFGFWIINIKLLLAGMQFTDKIKMSDFSGVDYAAAAAAVGSIYVLRKNKTIKTDNEKGGE